MKQSENSGHCRTCSKDIKNLVIGWKHATNETTTELELVVVSPADVVVLRRYVIGKIWVN